MPKGRKTDPNAGLALVLLRYLRGWDQGELARAAGIAPSQVSVYDRGERPVPLAVLEKAADAVGFPRFLLGSLLESLRAFRVAAEGRSRVDRVLGDRLLAEMAAVIKEMLAAVAPLPDAGAAGALPLEEEPIEDLWTRLERRTPSEREALVAELAEFQSRALWERVVAESRAAEDPRHALELADLARRIAGRAPGKRL